MSLRTVLYNTTKIINLGKKFPLDYILPLYHSVSDDYLPHLKHVINYKNTKDFENDLDFLSKNFEFTDWDFFKSNYSKPLKKPLALLTFDDGFAEFMHVVAPILEKKGIYAINFINPAFVDNGDMMFRCKTSLLIEEIISNNGILNEVGNYFNLKKPSKDVIISQLKNIDYNNRKKLDEVAQFIGFNFAEYQKNNKIYLTYNDLKTLSSKGFGIAAHSWDHPYYFKLKIDQQLANTQQSLDYLKQNQLLHETFAFPFTDFGVSLDFFNKIFEVNEGLKLTFGCAGVKTDAFSRNLQRVPMEYGLSAEDEIKIQTNYFMLKKHINKNIVKRK